ncbi:hydrolase [Streptomyces oceani]|uniref:Hydrolase n=2 Tax=Streptomyces oceani TaxID=1075402 RepID=A0A1E7KKZ5_9ACTN|nr:hydrolase [Streptomyces oceani]
MVTEALAEHVARWAELFSSGDAAGLDQLYEDGGVLVPVPGHPVTGPERSAANTYLLSHGVPMEARVRRCYAAGDIALLVVDWSLKGTGHDGTEIDMSGTATDVLRLGADGRWRYVIDNPAGVA